MNAIDRHHLDPIARAAILADAEEMLALALNLQGAGALVCSRRHAAYHEAGHAVAYRAHGQRCRAIKLYQRGGAWLGRTHGGRRWSVTPDTDPADDLDQARIFLAGPFAELLLSGAPAVGAGVDELALARAIVGQAAPKLAVDPQALMIQIVTETTEILIRYRQAVEALAGRLMRKSKLDGSIVNAILRAHAPDGTLKNPEKTRDEGARFFDKFRYQIAEQ